MATSVDVDSSNTGLFYDAYYSSVAEDSASFLARQAQRPQRPRLERLNLSSMPRDPFQIVYDGLSVEKTGTFDYYLDTKAVREYNNIQFLKDFPIYGYESVNKGLPPFVPSKPTLPALQSALGSISYSVFGFPTHRFMSRCLPDDCVHSDVESVLDPSDRIIRRPTDVSELYYNLTLSASPAEFLENAPQSVVSTINYIFREDEPEHIPTEPAPFVPASDTSSNDSDSTVDTPPDTPHTSHIVPLESPSTSKPDENVVDEIINGSSDTALGMPFNWVEAGLLPPPIPVRRYD